MSSFMTAIISFFTAIVLFFNGVGNYMGVYTKYVGQQDYTGFKDAYAGYFTIGTSISASQLDVDSNVKTILKNYNTLTFENELKQNIINPSEGEWHFEAADKIASFARANGIKLRGHCLLWSSYDSWMVKDGNGGYVSADVFYARFKEYCKVIMGRYGDVVYAWDVVNEPFYYGAGATYKDTAVHRLYGDGFVEQAFRIAHEVDPDALLYLNETHVVGNDYKYNNLMNSVKQYLADGAPINGIGLQGHYETPTVNQNGKALDKVIRAIAALGLRVDMTEMDMTVYKFGDGTTKYDSCPEWRAQLQLSKYKEIFDVLRKDRDMVYNVTFWGLNDAYSYCRVYNSRKDWPMLFDENNQPKEVYYAVTVF